MLHGYIGAARPHISPWWPVPAAACLIVPPLKWADLGCTVFTCLSCKFVQRSVCWPAELFLSAWHYILLSATERRALQYKHNGCLDFLSAYDEACPSCITVCLNDWPAVYFSVSDLLFFQPVFLSVAWPNIYNIYTMRFLSSIPTFLFPCVSQNKLLMFFSDLLSTFLICNIADFIFCTWRETTAGDISLQINYFLLQIQHISPVACHYTSSLVLTRPATGTASAAMLMGSEVAK